MAPRQHQQVLPGPALGRGVRCFEAATLVLGREEEVQHRQVEDPGQAISSLALKLRTRWPDTDPSACATVTWLHRVPGRTRRPSWPEGSRRSVHCRLTGDVLLHTVLGLYEPSSWSNDELAVDAIDKLVQAEATALSSSESVSHHRGWRSAPGRRRVATSIPWPGLPETLTW